MKIPKIIQKILDSREKLAFDLKNNMTILE